jgi:multidrug efflux system membrane fusion protein
MGISMSQDDLPPHDPASPLPAPPAESWAYEDQRRFTGRGKAISWVAGLLGLAVLVAFILYLSTHNSAGQNGAGGPGGGRGAGRGGGGRSGGGGRGGGGRGGLNQPTTVGTAKAVAADLPVQIEALGTVTPAATVTVKPQVAGTITRLLYREGQLVNRGQALAIIDPRPFQASLLQAQGALARDRAQLANAKVQLARYNTLLNEDSIARQDRDTQQALVHQLEGTIMVDQGVVNQAKINLGYSRIVAPVSGRVGLKVVDVGNYIGAGDANGIAVVTTLQPIDVEFAVPQQQVPSIERSLSHGGQIPALALDSTRTQVLDNGLFSTLDNRVDPTTGTVKGKARFRNAGYQLYPSQFVNVRLTIDTVRNAITIPPAAVRSGPDGSFVWLLAPDRSVSERKIKTGVSSADKVQVTDGLAIGDTVVTDGGDRLTEGAKVMLPGDQPPVGAGGGRGGRHRRGGAGAGGGQAPAGAPGQNAAAPPGQPGNAQPGAAPGGHGHWHGGQGQNGQGAGQSGVQGQPGAPPGGRRRRQGGGAQSGGGGGQGNSGQTG